MNPVTISTPVLGFRPFVLIEVDVLDEGGVDVTLQAGGIDATSPAEIAALAKVTRQGARQLRRQVRVAKKRAKADAKEASK